MKQVKLSQFDAALILAVLERADQIEAFKNEPQGQLFHYENITKIVIPTLRQVIESSQKKTNKKAS